MAGIIQQLTDIALTATPSVGSYLLSIDLDGVLKYKTDTGTISPVGSGGVGYTLIQEDLLNGLSFFPASGITHSEFFGPSGSILLLQNNGGLLSNNLDTNFKILNVDNLPTIGQPFVGVFGETASGSMQFLNGSFLGGNVIAYFNSVETATILQDDIGFDIGYNDNSSNYGSNINIGTNSLSLGVFNIPSGVLNQIEFTTSEVKLSLATQSSFKVNYQDDPFGSSIAYELFQIGHDGDFRLSNNKSVGTVSLLGGSASIINPLVTPNSIILATKQDALYPAEIAHVEKFGGSFSIYSTDVADYSTVGYMIINTI